MAYSVSKNTTLLTLSLVGQKILSFAYFAFIARMLGATHTGEYALALSFTTLFSILADFGFTPVVVREVARERDFTAFSPSLAIFLRAVFSAKIVVTAITVVLTIIASKLLGYDTHIIALISIGTVVMALDSFHLFFYGILRGLQDLRFEAVGMFVGQVVVFALGLIVLITHGSVGLLIAALAVGSAGNVINSFIRVHRHHVSFRLALPHPADLAKLWEQSWPFTCAGILARGYSQLDIILLSRLASTTAVGIYSVPSKMVFAFQFIPLALSASLYPALSQAHVHATEKMPRLVAGSLKYLSLIVFPLVASLIFFGALIVGHIFGPSFSQSVRPLMIIAPSMIFGFLDIPLGALLNATGNQTKQTLAMACTLLTNIIANSLLIPRFGVTGAATAALVSQGVLFSAGLLFSRKIITWPLAELRTYLFKVLISVIITLSVALILQHTLLTLIASGSRPMQYVFLGIGGLAFFAVYLVCVFATKLLTRADVRRLISHES